MQEKLRGTLNLHTGREGDLEVPCEGSVLLETRAGGEVVTGDVDLLEDDRFKLEAMIAALTECLTKHHPVRYHGLALGPEREGAQEPQQVTREVHIAVLAGKHVRFTSGDTAQS